MESRRDNKKVIFMISAIVAKNKNDIIGNSEGIPWYCPVDLEIFRKLTMGNDVVVGRKTWETLPGSFAKEDCRKWWVMSRSNEPFPHLGGPWNSWDELKKGFGHFYTKRRPAKKSFETITAGRHLIIAGGEEIYKQALERDIISRVFMTKMPISVKGEKKWPGLDKEKWELDREKKRKCKIKWEQFEGFGKVSKMKEITFQEWRRKDEN